MKLKACLTIVIFTLFVSLSISKAQTNDTDLRLEPLIRTLKEKGILTNSDVSKIKEEQKKNDQKALRREIILPLKLFTKKHLLEINSANKNFTATIRAYFHFDTRIYDTRSNNANSYDIRRARIEIRGRAYKYIKYRVQLAMAGSPYVRNCWLDLQYLPWLQIKLGQFKPAFSTQWITRDNNTIFLERASSNPIYPFF